MAFYDRQFRADTVLTPDIREKLERGPLVPGDFLSNGCSFIPEDLPGVCDCSKTPACVVHDYDYFRGGTWDDFRQANARLYRNLRALGVGRLDSFAVFLGVSLGGAPHFNFAVGTAAYRVRAWLVSEFLQHTRDVSLSKVAKAVWFASPWLRKAVYGLIVAAVGSVVGAFSAGAFGIEPQRNTTPFPDVPISAPSAGGLPGPNTLTESMLTSVNAPTDEYCLTYETPGGDFEWQPCGGYTPNTVEDTIVLTSLGTFFQKAVTGQAWVAAGSEIECTIFGTTADSLTVETVAVANLELSVSDKVVGTGFTVNIISPNGIDGTVRFHCNGS